MTVGIGTRLYSASRKAGIEGETPHDRPRSE